MKQFLSKNIATITVTSIILIIITPYVFTRSWGYISFADTGQIGDTIGGITAPIIGLITTVLLYVALREQQKTTKEQARLFKDERDYDFLFRLIEKFEQSLLLIKYEEIDNDKETHTGTEALIFIASKISDDDIPHFTHMSAFDLFATCMSSFTILNTIQSKMISSKIPTEDKFHMLSLINYNTARICGIERIEKKLESLIEQGENEPIEKVCNVMKTLTKVSVELNELHVSYLQEQKKEGP